jgi:sialate O-acetylesterase
MIAPHFPFSISGVIWYQGESNANRAKQYEHLFPMLISSWRKSLNNSTLNFYFVQLAGYDGKQSGSEIVDAWPHLRESQRLTLNKFSDIGMVVATDLGSQTNIHPTRKLEIGNRLSRLALYDVYGFRDIVRSSPLFKSVTYNKRNEAIVSFIEIGDGLKALNNKPLTGFMIAGEDRQFVEAEATILPDGKSIKIYSPKVSSPVSVRYGWSNNPTDANLGNSANLPASPFRTDNWALETDNDK